jgi:hypothetical protein
MPLPAVAAGMPLPAVADRMAGAVAVLAARWRETTPVEPELFPKDKLRMPRTPPPLRMKVQSPVPAETEEEA